MSRLGKILQMLQSNPNDAFLNFSLAMELVKDGRQDDAVRQFERVISLDPQYIAAYHQLAQLLVNLDRVYEAKFQLDRGIQAARGANDSHMIDKLTEMKTLLG